MNATRQPPAILDRPLLTFIDGATGERTDLAPADLGSWAARTASLLRDGCQLGAGDQAAVLLPPHWQTAAVLLGAWSLGVTVSYRPWSTAGLSPAEPDNRPPDAVFVSRQRLRSWLETVPQARHQFVLGLDPAGPTPTETPSGYRDFLTEVRQYPADTPAYSQIRDVDPASPDGITYRQWEQLAHGVAAALDIHAGDRLLIDTARHEQPVTWLLAPLVAGASIVLCANLDYGTLDAHIAAEGITRVL